MAQEGLLLCWPVVFFVVLARGEVPFSTICTYCRSSSDSRPM